MLELELELVLLLVELVVLGGEEKEEVNAEDDGELGVEEDDDEDNPYPKFDNLRENALNLFLPLLSLSLLELVLLALLSPSLLTLANPECPFLLACLLLLEDDEPSFSLRSAIFSVSQSAFIRESATRISERRLTAILFVIFSSRISFG